MSFPNRKRKEYAINNRDLIKVGKEVYQSNSGKNIIYEAEYNGEPCYLAAHVNYEHKALFDYDKKVLNTVIGKIKRDGAYVCDHKKKCDIFKFRSNGKKPSITLRYILFGKYNGIAPSKVKEMEIDISDDSLQKYNISDLRSCNLYDAGECRPYTDTRSIEIISNPNDENDKYIFITYHDVTPERIERYDYSEELYEMFTKNKYCNISTGKGNGRGTAVVHYAHKKDGYCIVNLARFVAVYKYHFGRYKNRKGSVKQFIRDFKKLNDNIPDGYEASHVNSCKTIGCMDNLMFMNWKTNNRLDNHIKFIDGSYKVFTAVNDKDEILIEYIAPDFSENGTIKFRYFKCPTPEDFLSWQNTLLGKEPLTEHLSQITFRSRTGQLWQTLSPCGMRLTGLVNDDTASVNEPDFWEWVEHKNALLRMQDSAFTVWNAERCVPTADEVSDGRYYIADISKILPGINGEAIIKVSPLEKTV